MLRIETKQVSVNYLQRIVSYSPVGNTQLVPSLFNILMTVATFQFVHSTEKYRIGERTLEIKKKVTRLEENAHCLIKKFDFIFIYVIIVNIFVY